MTDSEQPPTCFVASPSQPADLLSGLTDAIQKANDRGGKLQFHLWTKNDIAGRDLVAPILDHISSAPLFVADVTYLNLNVTYEVGYAIGKGKRVILTRYRGLKGDIDLAKALGLLQELAIGDAAAENEYTTLKSYFITTDAYGRTLQGQVDLVTGRKGSGKTALFFQVRDKLRSNKDNVIVDLKPEGYQLTQLKESVLKYLKAGSQTYLITSFWHYLILMQIVHRIMETDSQRHKFDHRLSEPFQELQELYLKGAAELEGDFSQRLLILTRTIAERYKELGTDLDTLNSADITQIVYLHDIRALEQALAKYLRFKDEVWILFDNLDKGWPAGGVTAEDIVILRCLIDAAKKLRNELVQKKINLHAVVFIRNDVYELLMERTADYGKETRVNLDWTDRRQLVELLLKRLEHGHKAFKGMPVKDIWSTIFADGREPNSGVAMFLDHSLLRPRNLIQLFQHCKGFAVNIGNEKITSQDVERALEAYSTDLVTEINREIADVFPQMPRALYDFVYEPASMSHDDLIAMAELKNLSREAGERFVELLLYYGFLGLPEDGDKCTYIYDAHYDMELLKALARKRSGQYQIHPAFWPALRTKRADASSDQAVLL